MDELNQKRNILITGGLGFIGSHLAKKYVEGNNNVTILSRSSSKLRNIQEISHHVPKKEIICVILYNCGIHPELNMVFLRRPSTGKRVPKPIFSSPTKAIRLYQCGQGNMRLFTNRYLVGFYTLPVNFQELYWFSVLHPNCLNLLINNE